MECKDLRTILTPIPKDFDVPFLRGGSRGYHYTAIEKLESIVKSRQLWFSSLADVNDRAEIEDGAAGFADFALRIPKKGIRDSAWWQNLVRETTESGLQEYFVFCLTTDEDSWPMWELYAGNTEGCCIGFNYSDLIYSLLDRNFETLKGASISYGFAVYDRKDKVRIFKTYVKDCGKAIESGLSKFFQAEKAGAKGKPISLAMMLEAFCYSEDQEAGNRCFSKSFPDFAFFKNRTFRYEKELRIAIRIPKERQSELENQGRIRTNGGRRFLCLDFDLKRSIRRICSAPGASEFQRNLISSIRDSSPCLGRVEIRSSASTIRLDTVRPHGGNHS